MNKPEKRRTTSVRKDHYIITIFLIGIGALIFRIPLGYLIGDKGMACFGTANEIYLVIAGAVSYGLSEAVAALVRYRVKREQYQSARQVLRGAVFLGAGFGLLLSGGFGLLGQLIAEKVLHLPLAGLAVSLMAPSMFFLILTGAFRGYFQGSGSRVPSIHSQILHFVFLSAGGLIGAGLLRGYGEKVSALLRQDDFVSAYGAMGASIGFLSASILCFLHAVILYVIYQKSIQKQGGREQLRNSAMGFSVFPMLLGTGAFYGLYWICFQGLALVDQCLFFVLDGGSDEAVASWGAYYGQYLVVLGILGGAVSAFCVGHARHIVGLADREEHKSAKRKLGILIHQCAVVSIPAAIFLAALSENIMELIFSGVDKQTVVWVQIGSVTIVFFAFAALFMEILIRSRKMNYVVWLGAGAFLLHAGLLALLLKTAKIGIAAVVLSNLAFYAVTAVAGFFLTGRMFQYRQEWIKSFAVTLIDAGICGLIAMLLNRALAPLVGKSISLLICMVVAILSYLVLLLVTRAFREGELEEMTGGRILMLLAGILRFL